MARPHARAYAGLRAGVRPASEADYAAEFLGLVIAVRVVDSLEDAPAHMGVESVTIERFVVRGEGQVRHPESKATSPGRR